MKKRGRPSNPDLYILVECPTCGKEFRSYKSDPCIYCSLKCRTGSPERLPRLKAIQQGKSTYYSGVPCKRGHLSERRVDSYSCIECTNNNAKKWARKYPHQIRLADRKWKKNNKDISALNHSEYYIQNREKLLNYNKEWNNNNKNRVRTYNINRRARISEGNLSIGLETKLLDLQKSKCAICKIDINNKYHLDHILPLALNGENTDNNIQLLCPTCNHRKHAKHPIDFMQENGYLL